MKIPILAVFTAVLTTAAEAPKLRLPGDVVPVRYELDLHLAPAKDTFNGSVAIDVEVKRATPVIWLHSKRLTIVSAKVGGKAAKVLPGGQEFIGLEAAAKPGRMRIQIDYSGPLQKNNVEGLFKQNDGGESYILTQFEPTSARLAFPCFDEPAFKTPWRITLRVPKGNEAFANTPVESDTTRGDTRVVRFRESKPLPSYLVALAVGPFDIIEGGTAGKNKTPLRVIATRGHRDEAKYTLEITPKVFNALEEYFGIPYPYEKLDQITIPVTVGFGAMENAGLITYRSSILLLRPQDDTVARRRGNTGVIIHEIAHQWFGNMVTPAWWDDIWLNEAFATWMTRRIQERLFPEWKQDVAAVNAKDNVMGADSLLSARKIRQPIQNEGDIGSAFDGITYQKGSAVIRMFENYVGPERFQKGIQHYMRKHAWGAATAREFFVAITEGSGKDVTSAFSTFLDRTGVPMLSVSVDCTSGTKPSVAVAQQRFLPIGSKGQANEYWQVPMCFEYDAGGGRVGRQCSIVADPKDRIALQAATSCPGWLNANDGGTGYYRVRYDSNSAQKLFASMDKLDLREQVDLLNNVQALLAAGQMEAPAALMLVPRFKDSRDRELLLAALNLAFSVEKSVPANLRPNYARFMLTTFGDRAREIGVLPKPGETEDAQLLRPGLIQVAARYGDQQVRREVKEVALRWLADPKSVPPQIAGLALNAAALNGDRAYFERLVAALRKSMDPRDRTLLVLAISSFRDPDIAKAALQLMLDANLDIRDTAVLLYQFNDDPETEGVAWPFLMANYDALLARLPSRLGNHPGSQLPRAGAAFCDAKGYSEVETFFKDRVKTMAGAERTLATVLEGIQLCGAKRAAQQAGLAEFLTKW